MNYYIHFYIQKTNIDYKNFKILINDLNLQNNWQGFISNVIFLSKLLTYKCNIYIVEKYEKYFLSNINTFID